jgi:hypothetical protein
MRNRRDLRLVWAWHPSYLIPALCLLSLWTIGCARNPSQAPTAILIPAPNSPLPINANCVAIADVNGDRHQDLILTVGTHLQTHFGDGAGNFKLAPDNDPDTHERATEMALGDVNGDGNVDVVLADHDRYSVSVFLGEGKADSRPRPGRRSGRCVARTRTLTACSCAT